MNDHLIQYNATQQLRRKVLVGMCIVLGLAGLLFGLVNILYFGARARVLGILELVYFVACFGMLFYIWKRDQPSWFLIFHCVVLTFLICFGTYVSRIESSLYIWAIALPTVFYLALGLRVGFYWSLICLALELFALHFALQDSVLVRSTVLLNFVLAYVFVWTISHVYEDSRVKGVDRLNVLAHQDALTGAQNRLALVTAFQQQPVALEGSYLYTLDIDDFKVINDSYGHAAGDEVLKEVVRRLENVVNRQKIYRMGGEEFVVVLEPELIPERGVTELVEKLQSSVMGSPINFNSTSINVTFSAGVEQFTCSEGLDKTLSKADNGLYLAKKAGKKCSFYQGKAVA